MTHDLSTNTDALKLAKILKLEEALQHFPQMQIPTYGLIHGAMFARTMFIPAGLVLTGAHTKLDNISIIFGDVTATTDEGPKRLTGYHVVPALSGKKRVVITHADTYWTTLIHTTSQDIEEIQFLMTDEVERLQTQAGDLILDWNVMLTKIEGMQPQLETGL